MEPAICRDDWVRIESARAVKIGDIVLFQGTRANVLHRIVLRIPATPWLVHCGDATGNPGLLHRSQVVGRATLPSRRLPPASTRIAVVYITRTAARKAISVLLGKLTTARISAYPEE